MLSGSTAAMTPGVTKPFASPVGTPVWMAQKQPFPLTEMKSPPVVCNQNTGHLEASLNTKVNSKKTQPSLKALISAPQKSSEEANTRGEEGLEGGHIPNQLQTF